MIFRKSLIFAFVMLIDWPLHVDSNKYSKREPESQLQPKTMEEVKEIENLCNDNAVCTCKCESQTNSCCNFSVSLNDEIR